MAEQPRGGLAWLWGLLFGGLAAAVILLDRFAPIRPARRIVAVGAIPLLPFVLGLLFFFLAVLIAARHSHRLESGLAAGLIAGASAGLMNAKRARLSGFSIRVSSSVRIDAEFGTFRSARSCAMAM